MRRKPDVRLHFHVDTIDTTLPIASGFGLIEHEATVMAFTSLFAGDPAVSQTEEGQVLEPLRFSSAIPLHVIRPSENNRRGCSAYEEGSIQSDSVLFVERGDCTFLEKLSMGKAVGAAGVIVASDTNDPINPTADPKERESAGSELSDVALVVVRQTDAQSVSDLLDYASTYGIGVHMLVEPQGSSTSPRAETDGKHSHRTVPSGPRTLYVNGRPLINVQLLV